MDLDTELRKVEEAMRRTRIEHELFLSGQRRTPPVDERRHLDQIVKALSSSPFPNSGRGRTRAP